MCAETLIALKNGTVFSPALILARTRPRWIFAPAAAKIDAMLELLIVLARALPLAFRGHRKLVLENLALRQQLTAVKRTTRRPSFQTRDRLFWIA